MKSQLQIVKVTRLCMVYTTDALKHETDVLRNSAHGEYLDVIACLEAVGRVRQNFESHLLSVV